MGIHNGRYSRSSPNFANTCSRPCPISQLPYLPRLLHIPDLWQQGHFRLFVTVIFHRQTAYRWLLLFLVHHSAAFSVFFPGKDSALPALSVPNPPNCQQKHGRFARTATAEDPPFAPRVAAARSHFGLRRVSGCPRFPTFGHWAAASAALATSL
jgi:hypothetical protein